MTRGGDGRHGWLMASGGGGRLPSTVLARRMAKEVKGDVWVRRRQLGLDGGGRGGQQIQGSGGGGGIVISFF
jgi:hypothetical protein